MNRTFTGMLSGFAATAPMTAAMFALHKLLPWFERYALPPRTVTLNLADTADERMAMSKPQRDIATTAAHFGYGAAAGGLYAAIEQRLPGPPVAKGIGWGLIVWAGSYLVLLPALRLHRPATREPAGRNVMMILAHVVWGASLGAMTAKAAPSSGRSASSSRPPAASRAPSMASSR